MVKGNDQASAPPESARDDPSPSSEIVRELGPMVVISTWRHLAAFSLQVGRSFMANKGLLLASALAYNALISLIPLLLVSLVVLSLFINQGRLLGIVSQELELIVPGQAEALVEAVHSFLDNRDVVGIVGLLVLLFLSSIAVRMVEESLAIIFKAQKLEKPRRFWISALIPYAYVGAFTVVLLFLTALHAAMQAITGDATVNILGFELSFADANRLLLYVAGWIVIAVLFASMYKILPQRDVSLSRALIGGLTAAVLWEISRRVLQWYFANLSLVNVFYGSLGTVIVVLLSFEVAALILLLGAEVIAELEVNAARGLPWHGRAVRERAPGRDA